jgi:hypothetical protein
MIMSLRAPIFYCIPDETARIAHAAFPKGNPYTLPTMLPNPC